MSSSSYGYLAIFRLFFKPGINLNTRQIALMTTLFLTQHKKSLQQSEMPAPQKCSVCRREGHRNSKKSPCLLEPIPPPPPADPVSAEALRNRYMRLRDFEAAEMADDLAFGYKTRRYGLPEHISENIIKFVIQNKLGDPTCSWGCTVGDLFSAKSKIIECKSLTSDGPTSFGPDQKWNEIFFLDARKWMEDEFHVWKCTAPSTHEVWKTLKISKEQTKEDQSAEHRRPRIGWEALYPQISAFCTEVYAGPFEGIFVPAPPPVPSAV
jgi:hypothetical protein